MTDVKFILPGPETVTLAGQTVDKLIRAGDGDAALLYLYILKTRGQSTSAQAAVALGKNPGGIATAMAVLSRLGLVRINEDANGAEPQPDDPPAPIEEPRQYTPDEIKREMETGSGFHSLVEETQRSLGKILSPDELTRLFGMYDGLRLPPEVILLLITHCINESRGRSGGRMPSVRYIEKAAYTWEREGIFSLDKAEDYLKGLEVRKSARGEIKKALRIMDREFSDSEKRYVDGWIAMGFNGGAAGIAYDRTVLKTGRLSWAYMDSIMKNWHGKGLHSPLEIQEKDGKPDRSGANKGPKTSGQKFGAPNHDDIERMKRILSKIKEE